MHSGFYIGAGFQSLSVTVVTLSSPSLHDYDVKIYLISRFGEDVNTGQ